MEKINVKQLQDVIINEEKVSVGEALQGFANFADVIYGEVETLGTKVEEAGKDIEDKVSNERLDDFKSSSEGTKSLETWSNEIDGFAVNVIQGMEGLGEEINNLPETYATKAQLADYVANQRLDEFNPDDSADEGLIERWAGGVNWQIDNLEGQVGMIASDATNLWGEFRKQESRLDSFTPSSEASEGSIEKWASTVGGGLPSATSSDAYAYIKVDSNGDFVIQQPLTVENNYGDEEFTGDLKNVPNAEIVQQLIQDSFSSFSDSVDYRIEDAVGDVSGRVDSLSSKVDAQFEYKVQEGNTITDTVTTRNMVPVPVTVNVDTSLISRGDVVCIYYPNKGASDFIKVTDYGVTPPSKGNVYPADVGADNPEKTIITISVNAPRLEDYPIPVEVTIYQVEKKQLDANTFSNVVDAFNQ